MMRKLVLVTLALGVTAPGILLANVQGPCEQIVAACTNAGFAKGDFREGYGLFTDCVDPLMRGTAQPRRAVRPLPAVSADLIAACKQRRPNFGEGKRPPPPPPPPPPAQ